jgi:hypothetical protein
MNVIEEKWRAIYMELVPTSLPYIRQVCMLVLPRFLDIKITG